MIFSRSSALLKLHSFHGRNLLENKVTKSLESLRRSHGESWYYRKVPPVNEKHQKFPEYFGAFLWWWITWHLVTDYEELLAHPYPDPSKWTDEELGVPPI